MRTARTFGAVIAFVFLLFWDGGAVGCNCGGHEECASIAPGTPVASLWVSGPLGYVTPYCWPVSGNTSELNALTCCASGLPASDSGIKDCRGQPGGSIFDCTKVAPADFLHVEAPYSDYDCAPDEGWGHPQYGCYVWVRDGGVVGACGGCPPD